jgi:predicted DNA-binding transcriptional regulator AlpA
MAKRALLEAAGGVGTEGEFLRSDQVEAEFGFSRATLAGWRYKGVGPPSARVGKRVLYRRSGILAWLEKQFAAEAEGRQRVS